MEARHEVGPASPARLVGILVIQEKGLVASVHNEPPAVVLRYNMDAIIQQLTNESVVPAVLIDLLSLFPVFYGNGGTASAKPVSMRLCLFETCKGTAACLRDPFQDLAMRKMGDLPV